MASAPVAEAQVSSSIAGGCDYGSPGQSYGSPYAFNWSKTSTTGDAVWFNYLDGATEDPLVPVTVYAFGAGRSSKVDWRVTKAEPTQTSAYCWSNDHTFANTFTVQPAAGSGLSAGDPVILELRPSIYGHMQGGTTQPSEGGIWNTYGEVTITVDAHTVSGEWLADFYAFANLNTRAEQGVAGSADPDGYLKEDWYTRMRWDSNIGFLPNQDLVESHVLCATWDVYGGCGATFTAYGVDFKPVVRFQTTVGARVTVTGFLDMSSDINEKHGGVFDHLNGLFAFNNFLSGSRGQFASVTAETPGVEIVWDADSPDPALSIGNATVAEGNAGTATASFTITLSPASTSAVSVVWATADGTATAGLDYTGATQTLTFAAGETSKTIDVLVLGDTAVEGDETFTVTLSNPSGAAIAAATGTGTIQEDDEPAVSISDASGAEGDSGPKDLSFTVSLSAPAASPLSVSWATSDGSAAAGTDYTSGSGSLSFSKGESSKAVVVQIIGDTDIEADETFTVALSSPSGATIGDATATGTITNDDLGVAPAVSGTPTSPATVGTAYSFAFTVTGTPAPTVTLENGGTLPPGLSLSTAGAISGTPTTAGTYQFAVRAANGLSPDAVSGTLTIVVDPLPVAPALSGTPTTPATVGTPYSFAFTVTGTPSPSVSVATGGLPPGLTLSSAGVISGTPTTAGTFTFTVAAVSSAGTTTSGSLTIVVNPAPLQVPTVSVAIHDSGHGTVTAAIVNTALHGSASVSGVGGGALPTGTVQGTWYANSKCTGKVAATGTALLTSAIADPVVSVTPTKKGKYALRVSYQGDGKYSAATGPCLVIQVNP